MSLLQEYLDKTKEWEKQHYPVHGPHLQPHPSFNPSVDADALEAAMKAKGVDEPAIIKILTNRTNTQRQQIQLAYQNKTGKLLSDVFKKGLSGRFKDIAIALLLTPAKFDAQELYYAMKGLGTDEACLIDILTSRNNTEIQAIKKAFKEEYKRDLIDAIKSDTSGDFCIALESLAKGERSEDVQVNEELVDADARALYEAGEKRKGTNTKVFIEILTKRHLRHICYVMQRYRKYSSNDFSKAVDLELKGDIEACLLSILKNAISKPAHNAEKFHAAIQGKGTRHKELLRLLISNSEGNMNAIKAAYMQKYSKSLSSDLMAENLGGDYEAIVLALCGPDA